MGILGSLLKVGGKLLKGVASKVTHGASDHVLKAVKSLGTAKRLLKPGAGTTIGMQALANRMTPTVRSSTVIRDAAAGFAQPGTYATKRKKRASPRRRARTAAAASRAARSTPRRARGTSPRRRASGTTGARRGPPRGGLNLKAMSVSWNAAGKPGTWREWVSNPATQIRNNS